MQVLYWCYFLIWRYSRTNSSAEGQKCYRSALPRRCTITTQKYNHTRGPVSGLRHVRLLHDNAPSHISKVVKHFLKSEKVIVLPTPTILSRPSLHATFSFFPIFKQFFSRRRYKSRQALGSAMSQSLRDQRAVTLS